MITVKINNEEYVIAPEKEIDILPLLAYFVETPKPKKRFYLGTIFTTNSGNNYLLATNGNNKKEAFLYSCAHGQVKYSHPAPTFTDGNKQYVKQLPTYYPNEFGLDKCYGIK